MDHLIYKHKLKIHRFYAMATLGTALKANSGVKSLSLQSFELTNSG